MKFKFVFSALMLVAFAPVAFAVSCSSGGYTNQVSDILTALNDKRITAVAPGGEEWNEDHCSGGNLFKVGEDGSAVDPRAFRGTWAASSGSVQYNYTVGGNLTYTWSLWEDGSGNLCWGDPNNSNETIATAGAPGGFTETCTP